MFNILPVVVTLGGLYLIFRLRAFYIFHPFRTARALFSSLTGRRARTTLALALAGTLGVGNIVGVAAGIIVGGAGSVFWLLISSAFAAALKYSEASLSSSYGKEGGMMYAVRSAFSSFGKPFSRLYAFLCILLSLAMGAALQSLSVVESLSFSTSIPQAVISIAFLALVFVVIVSGARGIRGFTAVFIPITTVVYIVLCLTAIFSCAHRLPQVITEIFEGAFTVNGAAGGAVGFLTSRAVSEGYSRGLLSNEAGAGTSSLAHSGIDYSPTSAGLIGLCEVIVDTVILCTLTALGILTTIPSPTSYKSAILLVLDGIGGTFGIGSRAAVIVCIFSFAFSTVVCWYYYGQRCVGYLFGMESKAYLLLFLTALLFGTVLGEGRLLAVCDVILLLLTLICVLALIKSSDRLVRLSELGGLISPRR